jgi:hypothetical protein
MALAQNAHSSPADLAGMLIDYASSNRKKSTTDTLRIVPRTTTSAS